MGVKADLAMMDPFQSSTKQWPLLSAEVHMTVYVSRSVVVRCDVAVIFKSKFHRGE